jgi:uncharacterized protein (UPF0218 family)
MSLDKIMTESNGVRSALSCVCQVVTNKNIKCNGKIEFAILPCRVKRAKKTGKEKKCKMK